MLKVVLFILIVVGVQFTACGHEYENTVTQKLFFENRKDQKLDTLIAVHTLNTGSLDLYYIQGKLTFPYDIKSKLTDSLTRDIKVCGNFPKDLIDMTSWNYDAGLAFKIIGKTILADDEAAMGKVPLFYVTEWTKFYYDFNSWTEQGDLNSYPNRKKMVNDIVKYFKLQGHTVSEIHKLLGKPDYFEQFELGYKVEEKYGSDIDPIATTTLTMKFDKDSVIRDRKIVKWTKNNR